MTKTITKSGQLSETCLQSLCDAKGEDIIDIDVRKYCSFTDTIIVASGGSSRKVAMLAQQLIFDVKTHHHIIPTVEGLENADWVVVDAGDVVIHLFRPEVRRYYDLVSMWKAPFRVEDSIGDEDAPVNT